MMLLCAASDEFHSQRLLRAVCANAGDASGMDRPSSLQTSLQSSCMTMEADDSTFGCVCSCRHLGRHMITHNCAAQQHLESNARNTSLLMLCP